jgi:hypothetical protein
MKDMLNVMSKFLAMGMTVDDVIGRSTWNPAREIHHEELGNLSIGSPADVTVLRVETGNFGFTDMYGARLSARQRFVAELTLRDGRVVLRSERHYASGVDDFTEGLREAGRRGLGRGYSSAAEASIGCEIECGTYIPCIASPGPVKPMLRMEKLYANRISTQVLC